MEQPKRSLTVDLAELASAFDGTPGEATSYLDLETGEVITITDEVRGELEEIYAEVFPDERDAQEGSAALDEALERRGLPDWMRDEARLADQVEVGLGTRYIEVPQDDSSEAYRDMEEFIATVEDQGLQERLWDAIRGRGAFRRFKEVLSTRDRERERWFTFKDARVRERVLEWLESEGIEAHGRGD